MWVTLLLGEPGAQRGNELRVLSTLHLPPHRPNTCWHCPRAPSLFSLHLIARGWVAASRVAQYGCLLWGRCKPHLVISALHPQPGWP